MCRYIYLGSETRALGKVFMYTELQEIVNWIVVNGHFLIFFKYITPITAFDRLCALTTLQPHNFPGAQYRISWKHWNSEGRVLVMSSAACPLFILGVRQLLQALGAVCVKPSSRQWFAFPTIPFALTLTLRVIWKSALQRMQRIESTGWSISSRATFCWHWNKSCTLEVYTPAELLTWYVNKLHSATRCRWTTLYVHSHPPIPWPCHGPHGTRIHSRLFSQRRLRPRPSWSRDRQPGNKGQRRRVGSIYPG